MSSLLLQRQLFRDSLKLFSTSSSRAIRKIVVKEEGKTITIEGAKEESPRAKNMIDPKLFSASSSCEAYEKCHPLCQFDKIHEIKHTDLLILEQFVDSEGELMPRKLTKLCERQHYRLNKLVGMAQKAGLMESKDKYVFQNDRATSLFNLLKYPKSLAGARIG